MKSRNLKNPEISKFRNLEIKESRNLEISKSQNYEIPKYRLRNPVVSRGLP